MRRVPETANRQDWPRLVAQSINEAGIEIAKLRGDVAALGLADAALSGRQDSVETRLDAVEAALAALPPAVPFQSFAAEPGSPVAAQTYFDTTLNKVRTWDGSAWQDHW